MIFEVYRLLYNNKNIMGHFEVKPNVAYNLKQ